MRVVIATLLAKPRLKRHEINYLVGFHHLAQSLRRYHAERPPLVVMSPDLRQPPPGADELFRIRAHDYEGIDKVQKAFGKSVYFKLDVFRLPADRIVYIDSDVLPFRDISELWDPNCFAEHAIYGMRESASLGLTHPDWQGRLNTGVMVINREKLPGDFFATLLQIAREGESYDLGDQGVVNAYLNRPGHGQLAGQLSPRYNMPSCVRTDGDWERHRHEIAMMHYLGPRKPWMKYPAHEWFHADTQRLWDEEVKAHDPPPKNLRGLASSLHTRIVRAVQWYEEWRGLQP